MERATVYDDLDLLFERAGDSYRIRVIRSPSGETHEQPFEAPFSDVLLENLVLALQRSHARVRRIDRPETERVKKFGGDLYEALFRDDLKLCLGRSLDAAQARGHGLRIRLRLGDCPALMDVPWEFMYDRSRNRFVCLSHLTPVVRYLDLGQGAAPLQIRLPLRILVMISDPADYDRLNVGKERDKLVAAVAPLQQAGRLRLEFLPSATLQALQRALRDQDYHVFHFIGHGGFDEARHDGVLLLENEDGNGVQFSGQEIGAFLSDHPSLRLAVLNACEGGRSDRQDPFAGVAQTLMQQGIPAVIAMQFEITDTAAITFAGDFYSSIVAGLPVDAALAEARKAIYGQPNPVEWATPVLYMRSADGTLFRVKPGSPATTPADPAAEARSGTRAPASRGPGAPVTDQARQGSQSWPETAPARAGTASPVTGEGAGDAAPGAAAATAPGSGARRRLLTRLVVTGLLGTGIAVIGVLTALHFLGKSSGGSPRWTTGGPVYSQPALAGGLVYVGSIDGKIYAFNASSGAVRWTHRTGGGIYASPVVGNGVLYIASTDGKIYALKERTGEQAWEKPYTTGNPIYSSPVVDGRGILYIGDQAGYIYAVNTTTGNLAWKNPFPTGEKIESNPAVYKDTVYVCTDAGKLYALGAAAGTPKPHWRKPFLTGTPGYCSVVVDNNSGTVYAGGTRGLVYALTPTRQPAWHSPFHTGGAILAISQVSRSNILYVASDDGKIYALNASTGKQRWARAIDSLYQSVPTANGHFLYVGSELGYVYILNAYTGTIERACRIGGQVRSTPRQVNGILYVGSSDRKVYRFNPAAGCQTR